MDSPAPITGIWDSATVAKALTLCGFDALCIAINLAFSCSLRIGEILALTWDDIHFVEGDVSWLQVNKTLQEVFIDAASATGCRGILFTFPPARVDSTMSLVLTRPKTAGSIRKVYLPDAVAGILKEWRIQQLELIHLLGEEYQNYGMVLAQNSGRPYTTRQIFRQFKILIHENNLPDISFHALRHASVTYKLALNEGDMKLVQGDTGHASTRLMMNTYAHILDDSRKKLAVQFEKNFYSPTHR